MLNSTHNPSDTLLKLVEGFKVVPIAGPTLDRQEMVAVIASPMSRPKEQAIALDSIAIRM